MCSLPPVWLKEGGAAKRGISHQSHKNSCSTLSLFSLTRNVPWLAEWLYRQGKFLYRPHFITKKLNVLSSIKENINLFCLKSMHGLVSLNLSVIWSFLTFNEFFRWQKYVLVIFIIWPSRMIPRFLTRSLGFRKYDKMYEWISCLSFLVPTIRISVLIMFGCKKKSFLPFNNYVHNTIHQIVSRATNIEMERKCKFHTVRLVWWC